MQLTNSPIFEEYVKRRFDGRKDDLIECVKDIYSPVYQDETVFVEQMKSIMAWCLALDEESHQVSIVSILSMIKRRLEKPIDHILSNLHGLYLIQPTDYHGLPLAKIKPLSVYRTYANGFYPVAPELISLLTESVSVDYKVVDALARRYSFFSQELLVFHTHIDDRRFSFATYESDYRTIKDAVNDHRIYARLYHEDTLLPLVNRGANMCAILDFSNRTVTVYANGVTHEIHNDLHVSDPDLMDGIIRRYAYENRTVRKFIANGYRA